MMGSLIAAATWRLRTPVLAIRPARSLRPAAAISSRIWSRSQSVARAGPKTLGEFGGAGEGGGQRAQVQGGGALPPDRVAVRQSLGHQGLGDARQGKSDRPMVAAPIGVERIAHEACRHLQVQRHGQQTRGGVEVLRGGQGEDVERGRRRDQGQFEGARVPHVEGEGDVSRLPGDVGGQGQLPGLARRQPVARPRR